MGSVIVDCAIYRDGHRTDGPEDFSDALGEAREAGGFVWIGLHEPTEKEFELVSQEFGLHPLAVEDALKAHQRPKLEVYDDSLFAVLKPVVYEPDSDAVSTGELMIFLGDAFAVVVRHGEGSPLKAVRRRLEHEPELLGKGPTAVLYAIADATVDHYLDVAVELQTDLEELEAEVFSPDGGGSRHTASRIYTFKRQVLEFRRATGPLAPPLARLAGTGAYGGGVPFVNDRARPFFRDVSDHLTRVNESVESLDRLVSDILSAHLAQTSVRQNDDMRKISAWAAMAAVPTMIAGIYGMNFDHMPEL
ncbi:magnesium transporter CorA, partial [Streptomyces sp. SID5914]